MVMTWHGIRMALRRKVTTVARMDPEINPPWVLKSLVQVEPRWTAHRLIPAHPHPVRRSGCLWWAAGHVPAGKLWCNGDFRNKHAGYMLDIMMQWEYTGIYYINIYNIKRTFGSLWSSNLAMTIALQMEGNLAGDIIALIGFRSFPDHVWPDGTIGDVYSIPTWMDHLKVKSWYKSSVKDAMFCLLFGASFKDVLLKQS